MKTLFLVALPPPAPPPFALVTVRFRAVSAAVPAMFTSAVIFAQAGSVESAAVVMDRDTGRSRGFGFVEMATADEADAAVKKFNGQELDGRTLKVELAKGAGPGGGRDSGGSRSGGGNNRSRW